MILLNKIYKKFSDNLNYLINCILLDKNKQIVWINKYDFYEAYIKFNIETLGIDPNKYYKKQYYINPLNNKKIYHRKYMTIFD